MFIYSVHARAQFPTPQRGAWALATPSKPIEEALDSETVTRAIVVWTGWGRTAWPDRDEAALVAEFGAELALGVLAEVRRLEDRFYSSEASKVAPDLTAMAEQAAAEFRETHPDVGEEAVQALAWSYTFDFK